MRLLLIAALTISAKAGISDLNCTSSGKYDKTAINCQNRYPSKECENIFGRAVEVNTDTERADKCFKNAGGAADEQMKQLAISTCPLTCGYCCLTPAFNCANKQFPRIACAAITSTMCSDPTWKQIIAEDCPNVCGFCQEGSCIDTAQGCPTDKAVCRHVEMQTFVKTYCKKTCGYCDGNTTTTIDCGDDVRCIKWIANGFCNNTNYSKEQKIKSCGKKCGLC